MSELVCAIRRNDIELVKHSIRDGHALTPRECFQLVDTAAEYSLDAFTYALTQPIHAKCLTTWTIHKTIMAEAPIEYIWKYGSDDLVNAAMNTCGTIAKSMPHIVYVIEYVLESRIPGRVSLLIAHNVDPNAIADRCVDMAGEGRYICFQNDVDAPSDYYGAVTAKVASLRALAKKAVDLHCEVSTCQSQVPN
jgi:hypothetical protein